MSKTKFYIIRHGESLGNFKSVFLGHTDWDITERGYKQADMTAEALRDIKIDAIYSSDLLRAYNTAIPNGKIHNLEVIKHSGLREIFAGDWEGKTREEISEGWGELFPNKWKTDFGIFILPNGEAIQDAGNRFKKTLEEIASTNPNKTILIVSHAAVIRAFYASISNIEPKDIGEKLPFPSTASYSLVEHENGSFTPIFYSEDKHMGSLVTKISYS